MIQEGVFAYRFPVSSKVDEVFNTIWWNRTFGILIHFVCIQIPFAGIVPLRTGIKTDKDAQCEQYDFHDLAPTNARDKGWQNAASV